MPNNYFKFKQFTVYQDKCAMKVGTDGVLLGAWADCSGAKTALDIGVGTGLISLMLAQRTEMNVTAIEINKEASEQAKENVARSKWSNRISIEHISIQDYLKNANQKFDLIVSNPPYFQNSLLASTKERSVARHNSEMQFDDLLEAADVLLSESGRMSVILPYLEGVMFILQAVEKGLYCIRQTKVLPNPGKEPKRLLLEFQKNKKALVEQDLIIELNKRHEYSEAYKNLTKDFYLAF